MCERDSERDREGGKRDLPLCSLSLCVRCWLDICMKAVVKMIHLLASAENQDSLNALHQLKITIIYPKWDIISTLDSKWQKQRERLLIAGVLIAVCLHVCLDARV